MNRFLLLPLALLLAALPAFAAGKPKRGPVEGAAFKVSPAYPKHVTADLEFRDPAGVLWPSFAYGKPAADGQYVYSATRPQAALTLLCDRMPQPHGDQSRRVLGELIKDEKPPTLKLTIRNLGPFQEESFEVTGKDGKKSTKKTEVAAVDAVLDLGGKQVPVKGKATARWGFPKDGATPDSVYLDIKFTVTGKDLGLKNPAATGPLDCRAGLTAYANVTPPPKKK